MQIRGAKRLQGLISEHQDTIRMARKLTAIHCQVADLPDDLSRRRKDAGKLGELCELLKLSEQQYQQWLAI